MDSEDAQEGTAVARPRVVAGVDGSPGAREALVWAFAAAARRGAGLDVVSAFPSDLSWNAPSLVDPQRIAALRAGTEARARELVAAVRADPVVSAVDGIDDVPCEVRVVPGAPAEQLVQMAEGAALLVVGSRGRGLVRSTLLGSVALHCAAHAPCPVVVVHPGTAASTTPGRRVVVGLDPAEASRVVLAHAAAAAEELGAELEVVAAYHLPHYWTDLYVALDQALAEIRASADGRARHQVDEVLGAEPPVPVRVVTEEGPAGGLLVHRAAGAALLVIGSRSRNRLPGMVLGSVALHGVVHAPCPVLVVHPPRRTHRHAEPPALAGSGG
ncbi:universal stress protein [Modestobacter sp. I12A-02662]|uniref:universal stress protein n=1 Tax=Modestobacter sp. I12A-02662 TaxID=1730496 RepID=UPI0034DF8F22